MTRGPRRRRPKLDSVTLVAVTSVALRHTLEAVRLSMAQADFGQVLLLSDRLPAGDLDGVRWVKIPRLASRVEYSRFMIRDLAQHIETAHALCVQWDGFVLDGSAWDPSFLDYDYIGAPWPHFHDSHNVGNGGFSLRSRTLLEACREMPFHDTHFEDVMICRHWRPALEQRGLCFAPESVARRFSYERTSPKGDEFGFHGAFNLARLLRPKDALRLFRSLEQGMLAKNERWEVLGWALRHGRIGLAAEMIRRLA